MIEFAGLVLLNKEGAGTVTIYRTTAPSGSVVINGGIFDHLAVGDPGVGLTAEMDRGRAGQRRAPHRHRAGAAAKGCTGSVSMTPSTLTCTPSIPVSASAEADVRVTDREVVEDAPPLITTEPLGAVVSR